MIPDLATLERTARIYDQAGVTPAVLRNHIFESSDRINSRGERIAGNGLAETGAILRQGRKILIDVAKYGQWLAGVAK